MEDQGIPVKNKFLSDSCVTLNFDVETLAKLDIMEKDIADLKKLLKDLIYKLT